LRRPFIPTKEDGPINCPNCGHHVNRVVNTRKEGHETILRQRVCLGCIHSFHTMELALPTGTVRWRNKLMERIEGYKHIEFS
jgi:transcriptional regulator NrdR family protein